MSRFVSNERPRECPECGASVRTVENKTGWIVSCFQCIDWHRVEREGEES